MNTLRILLARLRAQFGDRAQEARLDEEIAAHVNALAARYEARGLSPTEARHTAQREFGGVTQVREQHREQRRLPFADTAWQDLRYAFRQMAAHPAFTAAAVLTLGLGIGANTAVFRVLDAVVLSPLPVPHGEQLRQAELRKDNDPWPLAYPQYAAIAAHTRTFAHLAAAFDLTPATGSPTSVRARLASGEYFPSLGVNAAFGRTFGPADDQAGEAATAVISDAFWHREFGGAADALGRTVTVNGLTAMVIGVMPRGFFGESIGTAPDVWIPMAMAPRMSGTELLRPSARSLRPFGRLAAGVSDQQAEAELDTLYAQYASLGMVALGVHRESFRLAAVGYGTGEFRRQVSASLAALMAISGLVLLVACCNLANLLLARTTSRTHEMGVRMALGAGRARLLRQLLTESLTLAALGAGAGVTLASWGSRALVQFASAGQGWRLMLDPDLRVLGFTLAITVCSVCVFGLAPAMAASQVDVQSALQASRRLSTGRMAAAGLRMFVPAQVAVGLVLVSSALLLIHSFRNLSTQNLGYRAEGLLIVRFKGFPPLRKAEQSARVEDALNAMPGVTAAGVSGLGPFGSMEDHATVTRPDQPGPAVDNVRVTRVTPRYLQAMGIEMKAGRAIDARDQAQSVPVAVLTETAARRFFGGESPIGRKISTGRKQAMEVVGVARDLRFGGPREEFWPLVLVPYAQYDGLLTAIAVRTKGDPHAYAKAAIERVSGAYPQIRPASIEAVALDDLLASMMAQDRLVAALSAIFGGLALALTSIGLYGVIAHAVQARMREIGVRMALGAERGQVTAMLLRSLARTLAIGIAFGLAGTLVAGRLIQSMLFGLAAEDGTTIAAAVALLAAVGLLAGYLPARRAARMDPMRALRQE